MNVDILNNLVAKWDEIIFMFSDTCQKVDVMFLGKAYFEHVGTSSFKGNLNIDILNISKEPLSALFDVRVN